MILIFFCCLSLPSFFPCFSYVFMTVIIFVGSGFSLCHPDGRNCLRHHFFKYRLFLLLMALLNQSKSCFGKGIRYKSLLSSTWACDLAPAHLHFPFQFEIPPTHRTHRSQDFHSALYPCLGGNEPTRTPPPSSKETKIFVIIIVGKAPHQIFTTACDPFALKEEPL